MKYDETTAKALQKKYDIPSVTLRVWKSRNAIPDHWQDGDVRNRADEKDQKRIIEIISLEALKYSAFTSISKSQFSDVKRYYQSAGRQNKPASFTQSEIIAFKSEIVRLRNFLRKFLNKPNEAGLLAIFAENRIKHFVLFREHRKMIYRLMQAGGDALEEELEYATLQVAALYSALRW